MRSSNHNSIRPGFIIALAVGALLALAGILRVMVLGDEALVLFDTAGMAFAFILCAIAFRIARNQEAAHEKRKA
jgi:hypothetical protein